MLRQLELNDIEAMMKVVDSSIKRGAKTIISKDEVTLLLKTDRTFIVGVFEGEVLSAWMAYRFGVLGEEKIWVIVHFFSVKNKNTFSFDKDFQLIVEKIIEKAESIGHYSYFYAVRKQNEHTYEKAWARNQTVQIKGRYHIATIHEIKANTLPDVAWISRLLGNKTHPYDMVIRKRTLKEEYRKV